MSGNTPGRLLGNILWFTIAGGEAGSRTAETVLVDYDDLDRWFDEIGLDRDFLPVRISAINAWRAASSKISAEYELPAAGQKAVLRVKEVSRTNDQIIRQVVREVTDSRRAKLSSDKVAELRFNRGRRTNTGRVHGSESHRVIVRNDVPPLDAEKVAQVIATFEKRYEEFANFRDADDIRQILRSYLRALDAIIIKPAAGIYFVRAEHQGAVEGLQALVSRIGQGSSLDQVPLYEDDRQLNMLADAIEEQTLREALALRNSIEQYVAEKVGPSVPVLKYSEFRQKYDAIVNRRSQLTADLGLPQRTACLDGVEAARLSLTDLMSRVTNSARR